MANTIRQSIILQLRADIAGLQRDLNKATSVFRRSTSRLERTAKAASRRIGRALGSALSVAAIGLGVRGVIRLTDELKRLEGQLTLVTAGPADLENTFQRLQGLANETRSGLSGTVTAFAKVQRAGEAFGLTQDRALGVTRALNQAIQISGATAQEASAGAIQFAQGLASSRLQGDELRSILENLPRLAIALADGLGVTIGQLRELGKEGALTNQVVTNSLLSQAAILQAEFEQLPLRVGQALTRLRNDVLVAFGDVDTSGIIDALDELREQLTDPAIVQGLTRLAQGLVSIAEAAAFAGGKIGQFIGFLSDQLTFALGGTVDNVEALQQRIEDLTTGINVIRGLGLAGVLDFQIEDNIEEIQRLERDIARLNATIGETKQISPENLKFVESLEQIIAQGNGASDKLKQVNELIGANAEAVQSGQQVRADFEKQLKALNELGLRGFRARKLALQLAALELRNRKELAAASSEENKEAERLAERRRNFIRGLERQLALAKAVTDQQRIAAEVEFGQAAELGVQGEATRLLTQIQIANEAKREREEREQLRQTQADQIQALQNQLVFARAVTQEQRLQAELAVGRFKDFSAEDKGEIERIERERFAIERRNEENRKAEEQRKAAIEQGNQLREQIQRSIRLTEEEVKVGRELTDAEKLRFELREGHYAELPPKIKKVVEELANEKEAIDKVRQAQIDQAKEAEEAQKRLEQTARDLGLTFSSAFEDAIVEGKKFSEVLRGLEQDILRILTRKLITEPIANFLTESIKSLSSGGGGGLGGLLSGLFGGRQLGGAVQPGRAFVVGEAGRELFIPSVGGQVLDNADTEKALKGNNVVNITLNGVQDFDSFRRNEAQLALAATRQANRASRRNG